MYLKKNRVKWLYAVTVLLVILIVVGECTRDKGNPAQGPNEIWMQNIAFVPTSITVKAGTTVTWTNKDNIQHTSSSDSTLWDSGLMDPGSTFTHQFTTAGTYPFHCNVHSMMHGTIIVQ